MMKKIKKLVVIATMMVMIVCNCLPVSATTKGVNSCDHNSLSLYDKIEVHREFLYTHTEYHGTTTIVCNVYEVEYVVRYRCNECGYIALTTTETKEIHVN